MIEAAGSSEKSGHLYATYIRCHIQDDIFFSHPCENSTFQPDKLNIKINLKKHFHEAMGTRQTKMKVLRCRSRGNNNVIYHLPCDKYPREERCVGLDTTDISVSIESPSASTMIQKEYRSKTKTQR